MGKQELSGYSFPRFPERWSEGERQFALGLRRLFDTLFGEQANISREIIQNSTRLSETISRMGKDFEESFATLAKNVAEAGQRFETIEKQFSEDDRRMDNAEKRIDDLEQFDKGAFDLIYPIGITVFTQSGTDAPFGFGTWEVENVNETTQEPEPDAYGHYMWRRVEDET